MELPYSTHKLFSSVPGLLCGPLYTNVMASLKPSAVILGFLPSEPREEENLSVCITWPVTMCYNNRQGTETLPVTLDVS